MASIGDGLSSEAIEQNPDVAQIQAKQLLADSILGALPATGFVASLNGLSGLLTIQAGSSSTGVTVVVSSDGVSTISIGVLGITAPGTAKSNIAILPPTIANDESEGYNFFSLWLNTTVPEIYMCASPATLAAIWLKISP